MDNSFDVFFSDAPVARPVANACLMAMFREKACRIRGNFGQFSRRAELAVRSAHLYSRNRAGYDPRAIRPTSTER
ncbi:hypothetical protein A1D31_03145 [Bradyrhizobium liaoningense]|nr:hypothetical protein A1D31_03145 [Bradyrhizobium liaoningense]